MTRPEGQTGVGEVRCVLADAGHPLTVAEVFSACASFANTTAVALALSDELHAERVERSGTRGHYKYSITPAGREAADNPLILRSRFQRRPQRVRRWRGKPLGAAASREGS